jgi:hypothetical protein
LCGASEVCWKLEQKIPTHSTDIRRWRRHERNWYATLAIRNIYICGKLKLIERNKNCGGLGGKAADIWDWQLRSMASQKNPNIKKLRDHVFGEKWSNRTQNMGIWRLESYLSFTKRPQPLILRPNSRAGWTQE